MNGNNSLKKTGVSLEKLSWQEAELWLQKDSVVVIPMGAAAKEHGLHLPLNTDAITANWLAEQLMGITPLGALRIRDDLLELEAPIAGHQNPQQQRFRVDAEAGTVIFRSDDGSTTGRTSTALPMDANIQIEQATLSAGRLLLSGHARVTPD